LTSQTGYDNYPTWSPDGNRVAFARVTGDIAGIYTVPVIGGEARCVYRTNRLPRHLDWSPDGRWIVFSKSFDDGESTGLVLLDLLRDDRTTRILTRPDHGESIDTWPRFSPAGDRVAFVRTDIAGMSDVYCVPVSGGRSRRLTRGQISVWGLAWHPSGTEVYFSSFAAGPYQLSTVAVDGPRIRRIFVLSEWVRYPTTARNGTCLAFESRRETQDIMLLPLNVPAASTPSARPLIVSNALDCQPAWSPDGTAIAFVSTRSGHRELWACDGTGSHLRQLTKLAGPYVADPSWSPDSRQLIFVAAGADVGVYVVGSGGGPARRITPAEQRAFPCSWSRDGKRIYYACETGVKWQIWEVYADGTGMRQVSENGGIAAIESEGGNLLNLVLPDRNGIWSRFADGRELTCTIPELKASQFRNWAVAPEGVYFARTTDEVAKILLHDSHGQYLSEIAEIPSYPDSRFSISPNAESLLFVRSDQLDIDLLLLDRLP
jgi:Tol biopolymer transport system component